MELSVANHQYWLLEDVVMVILFSHWFLDTVLINGNVLETSKIHEINIEQSQMMIESMSSVEMDYCKS